MFSRTVYQAVLVFVVFSAISLLVVAFVPGGRAWYVWFFLTLPKSALTAMPWAEAIASLALVIFMAPVVLAVSGTLSLFGLGAWNPYVHQEPTGVQAFLAVVPTVVLSWVFWSFLVLRSSRLVGLRRTKSSGLTKDGVV